jgi:thiamine monophosphate synthase
MAPNKKIRYYFFIKDLNQLISKNLEKYKNYSLIYNPDNKNVVNINEIIKIQTFCKKNSVLFFLKDNYRLAHKYKANGIFLSSRNKIVNPGKLDIKLKILGSAHNQLEYYHKMRQNCETIMFSPIFKTNKYSQNKILNISKFNLISKNWKVRVCALGGITNKNLKKIYITRAEAIAGISIIKKNPPTTVNSKWVFLK